MNRDRAPEALRDADAALARFPECPYHLVRRAAAIQLQENADGPGLEDVEHALVRAHTIDPRYIDALGELAHFYDVILPDPEKATVYAELCLERAKRLVEEMNDILTDNRGQRKPQG